MARKLVEPAERRADLLGAARNVFARKGFHAATVDDITRAAGVAKGTFYLYFAEKKEIYFAVIREFLQRIKDIGRSVGESTGIDFVIRAEQAARQLMEIFLENRDMARLVYRESMGFDRDLDTMMREFYRDVAEVEAANIKRGIELGLFRPVDALLVAYAHIGMIERVLLTLLENENVLGDPEKIVAELLGVGFQGLMRTQPLR
jgi:AcrR family transcriptional regulator